MSDWGYVKCTDVGASSDEYVVNGPDDSINVTGEDDAKIVTCLLKQRDQLLEALEDVIEQGWLDDEAAHNPEGYPFLREQIEQAIAKHRGGERGHEAETL